MKNRVIPLEVKGTVKTIINGKRRRTVEKEYHQKKINEALKIFCEAHLTCSSDGGSYDYDGNHRMGDIIIINIIAKLLERIEKSEWHYVKDELPKEMQEVIICIKDEKRITRAKRIKNDLWTSSRGDFNTKEIIAWKEIVLPKESE